MIKHEIYEISQGVFGFKIIANGNKVLLDQKFKPFTPGVHTMTLNEALTNAQTLVEIYTGEGGENVE